MAKPQKIPKKLHKPLVEEIFPDLQQMVPDSGNIDRARLRAGLAQNEKLLKWILREMEKLNRRVWDAMEEQAASASMVSLAKTQNPYQPANGELSVKLLDANLDETGDAFNVYAFDDQAADDVDDFLPKLDKEKIVSISQAQDGQWYMKKPTLIAKGTDGSTVSTTAVDLTGAVLNSIGKW